MISAFIVFVVQVVFMFFIDHKYRFLSDGSMGRLLMFQGVISTMYVFIIPMVAKGQFLSSIAYIIGSIVGSYISYKLHKKG